MVKMEKAFDDFLWENYPNTNTPLGKRLLNKVNSALKTIDERVMRIFNIEIPTINNTKLDITEAYKLVKGISLNEDTGVFTITFYDNTQITIDTMLEKLAVNFDYYADTQKLVIILSDGTQKEVDLSALITQYEFLDSDTVHFSVELNEEKAFEKRWINPEVSFLTKTSQIHDFLMIESDVEISNISGTYKKDADENYIPAVFSPVSSDPKHLFTVNFPGGANSCIIAAETEEWDSLREKECYIIGHYSKKGTIKAVIKEGSIQEKHLRPDYLSDIRVESANAESSKNSAALKASESAQSALLSKSYSDGTSGIRDGESTDNAKYYSNQAKEIYDNFTQAGTVTGVKGASETTFRGGNVNLTPENIGAPSNEYMEEHFVPDYISQNYGAIFSSGWYRIAQLGGGLMFADSCVVSIKRFYNSPSPEYQKVQLVNSYHSNKIIPIVSFTGSDGTHIFTKIRKVYDSVNSISYIEIYQDRDTAGNSIIVNIMDAVGYNFRSWKVIEPVPTQETVEGVNVLASLDLPANFDISMLLGKSGGTMDGIINFINNGGIRFTAPNLLETARGIDILDKNGNKIGGMGIHAKNGIPDYLYASLGGNNSHDPSAGLSIYADKMKWKNSEVVTEDFGANAYASKDIYGDSTVSMGRKSGSTIGNSSFAFGNDVVASGMYAHAEGANTIASGAYSHAEGGSATANTMYAHAEGNNTTASNYSSHSCGKYNKPMAVGGALNTQIGDVFVVGNGISNSSRSNALRITYQGDVLGTKAFQSSGADYAEFVKPWADGNPYNEDRIGYFVTVRNGLLYKAEEGDYIVGVTSGNPSIVGNADEDYYWKYERDVFNRIVMEDVPEMVQQTGEDGNPVFDEGTHEPVMVETGNMIPSARMKLADNYDPSLQDSYTPRSERKEWDYVGMRGLIPVRDDGTCIQDRFCKCGHGGIATLAEERGFDTFYVIERISENIISVEI